MPTVYNQHMSIVIIWRKNMCRNAKHPISNHAQPKRHRLTSATHKAIIKRLCGHSFVKGMDSSFIPNDTVLVLYYEVYPSKV